MIIDAKTVETKEICVKIAYLIGVRKGIIEVSYPDYADLLEELSNNKEATIIRYLCKLRTALMQKFKKTDGEIRYNLKNLDRLPEYYDVENIRQLEKWGLHLIKPNHRAESYATDITRMIAENIDKCSKLFYDWINWGYIKDLFIISRFNKTGTIKAEFNKYMANISYYPFQMYIYWKPANYGGILINDMKFLHLLYQLHGDTFKGDVNITDAHSTTKDNIYDFINGSGKTAIAVDCENADVYKLYSVLKNLNQKELSKIYKITLYDDSHTTDGWDKLKEFVKIPVEHIVTERISSYKSLVDIKMTAGVCKDFYENGVTSFIIVSSDSDFWGLISSMPTAEFLVMYEYSKCGQAIRQALDEHNIYSCSVDDFCIGNIEDLKLSVLTSLFTEHFADILNVNVKDLVSRVYTEARIKADSKEMDNFFKKYVKSMQIKIDDNGNASLQIPTL